jgi:hypothetical protein
MPPSPQSLRVYLLGRPTPPGGEVPLTCLAEHALGRALERRVLSSADKAQIDARVAALRGFIGGRYPPFDSAALEELGALLFELLVPGAVRRLYDRARPDDGTLTPLEIVIESQELTSWPWEYAFDPTTRTFVCQEVHPVTRGILAMGLTAPLRPQRSARRILAVLGVRDRELAVEEELKWIRDRMPQGTFELEAVRATSNVELDRILNRQQFDVLHFIGHAGVDPNSGLGYLELSDDRNSQTRLSADQLAQALARRRPRLVFMNACRTGAGAADMEPSRSSIAAVLLHHGIPAVIATQFYLPDATAHMLSSSVYESLANGNSVADALRDGRRALGYLHTAAHLDWGIPVLYTVDPHLVLYDPPQRDHSYAASAALENTRRMVRDDAPGNVVRAAPAPAGHLGPDAPALEAFPFLGMFGGNAAMSAQRTANFQVALADLDAKVGFLPDIVEKANNVQSYYTFRIVEVPIPAGTVRRDIDEEEPQTFLPALAPALTRASEHLKVDWLCGFTRYMVAGEEEGELYWNHFAGCLENSSSVFVVSTHELRHFAELADLPFANAVFMVCIAMLIVSDERWQLDHHDETVGCPMDMCWKREDIVVALKHGRFDHNRCRRRIKDIAQLEAIDALLSWLRRTGARSR